MKYILLLTADQAKRGHQWTTETTKDGDDYVLGVLGISSLLLMCNGADATPCENFGVFVEFQRNQVDLI